MMGGTSGRARTRQTRDAQHDQAEDARDAAGEKRANDLDDEQLVYRGDDEAHDRIVHADYTGDEALRPVGTGDHPLGAEIDDGRGQGMREATDPVLGQDATGGNGNPEPPATGGE